MKKLITLIVVASLALTIQAQDITNKLGSGGEFSIEASNDLPYMRVFAELFNDYIDFTNVNAHSHFRLTSVSSGDSDAMKLEFRRAKGDIGTPEAVVVGDYISDFKFHGYVQPLQEAGGYKLGAELLAVVDNTSVTDVVGTKIVFVTVAADDGHSLPTESMSISSAGTLNITQLFEGTAAATGDKAVYVTSTGDLVAGAARSKSFNNQNQLEEEIETLKAEMAELRSMIEMLMEEK